ncbi:alpha-hydroxy acid oxidase [Hyphococcus flavus]|uniref:Alpha-hydroxy acid oxidase n=1 Tax=Hyphococcus flavus TaxID=1866326 RepID=A0AAE9ZDU0_9PROT|nr:alpha-hydroxy acid oxidase [Hyphococcus flavus]WDI32974.1 alpha-hydroxy acid oxidase [Hyphococcus flavus]
MTSSLKSCLNIDDLRTLAKRRLPAPIFHYIDGAAEDETTYRRNTESFETCDLVPNVLASVENIDLSVEVFGKKLAMPLFCSPTALQRLFHHDGERAVGRAAEKFGTLFGVSSLTSVRLAEISKMISTPKMFQFYYFKDKALNAHLLERAKAARFDVLALTVDTIVGGNRERDQRTGFTTPPKLTPASLLSFAAHPAWTMNFLTHEKFALAELVDYVAEGSNKAMSIGDYFSTLLDQTMDWDAAAELKAQWGGKFCLKGVMSVEDARRAAEMGCDAIMVSNHGGRQLDGSRSPFDQIAEIADAVGDRLDIILDGGVRRGSHVLKALAAGAKACSGGRMYLYALAAAGQPGVEHALRLLRAEIERDMKLMGVRKITDLDRDMLRYR